MSDKKDDPHIIQDEDLEEVDEENTAPLPLVRPPKKEGG